MELQIERVVDAAAAAELHAILAEAEPFDHPGLEAEPLDDIVGMLPDPLPSFRIAFYLARGDEGAVASGFLGLPTVENTHTANVHVIVALGARRRGVGTQMAQFLLDLVRAEGRRVAIGIAGAPLGGTSPGNEMAVRMGATAALVSVRRQLRLDELDRAELEARCKGLREEHGAPYDLVSWVDTCPDHLVDGAAALVPRVMSDSPQGELDVEDEVWDVARYREYEAMFVARRRHQLATAAVERATGRFVAFTDLNVPFSEHRVVAQFGTVVEPDHRGHRLGLAVKTRNLINLLDAYPDAQSVQTYNAAENVHMIAVNEALGFRAVERSTHWQLTL
jgi:GNAT superfamily N-acetyltransferase